MGDSWGGASSGPQRPADTPGGHQGRPPLLPLHVRRGAGRTPRPEAGTTPGARARLSFLGSMITVADAELLEREEELDALRALLADAREGCGGIAVVEGPAGQGKTALLRAVRAEATGMRVLHAVGAELERDFPFGIVRQLFLPALRSEAGDLVRQRRRARTRGPQRRLRPGAHHRRLPLPPARAVLARRQPRRARAAGDRRRRRPLGRRRQPEGARRCSPAASRICRSR